MSWNSREILLLGAGAMATLLAGRPAESAGTPAPEAGGVTPYVRKTASA